MIRSTLIGLIFIFFLMGEALQAIPQEDEMPGQIKEIYDMALEKLETNPEESLKLAKKALKACEATKDKPCMARTLNLLGHVKKMLGNYDGALKCLNKALHLGEGANKGLSLTNIGLIYYYQGDNMKSLDYHKKALKVYDSLGDDAKMAAGFNNIGLAYSQLGNYEKAIENYLTALEIKERMGKDVGHLLNNIGEFYTKVGDDTAALRYFEQALQVHQQIGRNREQAYSLAHMGMVFYKRQDYKKSAAYHREAFNIRKSLSDVKGMANSLNSLGKAYLAQDSLKVAKKHFLMSLALNESLNSKNEMAISYLFLGEVYLSMGNASLALENFSQAISLSKAVNAKEIEVQSHEAISKAYISLGRYKEALGAYTHYATLRDSLSTAKTSKEIFVLQKEHELDRKEKEITLLQKDKALQTATISRVKIIIYAISIGFIFLLVMVMIILRNRRKERIANALLHEKNEQINKQKIVDLVKDQQLRSVQANIEGQETEKQRIAKELHDGLGATLSTIKLRLQHIDGRLEADEKDKLIHVIDKSCEEVRTISHHLTPPGFAKVEFVDLLKNYIDEISSLYQISINAKFFPEEELNLLQEVTQTEIYRIIQELMNNVIKHANATKVSIQMLRHERHINLLVEDNGVGFDAIEENGGIGLLNIRARVKLLQGNFDIDSKKGRGTIINIDLSDLNEALVG